MRAPETCNPLRGVKTPVLHARLRRLYAAADLPMPDDELTEALGMIEAIEAEIKRRQSGENLPACVV